MLQKCAILGLVILLAGGGIFGWLYREAENDRLQTQSLVPVNAPGSQEYIEKYGRWYQLSPEQQNQLVLELDRERKSKTPEQLDREQQARLHADLDKLADGQMYPPSDIADFLYGPGWESQVEQHKKQKEQAQTVQTTALVCVSIGGVLFGGSVILGLLRLLVRAIRALRRRSEPIAAPESKAEELANIDPHDSKPPEAPDITGPEGQPKQRRKLMTLSEASAEAHPTESGSEPPGGLDDLFHVIAAGAGPAEGGWPAPGASPPVPGLQDVLPEGGAALLLTDEPAQERAWSPQAQWSLASEPGVSSESQSQEPFLMRRSTVRQPDKEGASTVEKTLKVQAEDLQKQIAEFKQVAQNVQQATREQSAPLGDTLKELTQQVSAIREYAASQQGRVEKLQDGYDWGIIRTFCLRVIRCIDNLEGRLADLPKDDGAAQHLEEVKDELLFALESSGIEQFRPELNSEFQGQEKLAEALKEKQPAKKPGQEGKIARVIRPGYRYMMDDENYRVVRIAQVKVYG